MTERRCQWCGGPIPASSRRRKWCSQRCRQAGWRSSVEERVNVANLQAKRIAYADPPYPGKAWMYRDQPSYAGEVDHVALLQRLQHYDGWALSTSAKALRELLPLCPEEVRVCPWVKPIGVSARSLGLHNAWEPVIVMPARRVPPGMRDWLRAMPARGNGELKGRKPTAFVHWLIDALGAVPTIDSLDDLFPGTGIVGRVWELRARGHQLALPGLSSVPSLLELGDGSEPSPGGGDDTELEAACSK